jgi:endonuclease G
MKTFWRWIIVYSLHCAGVFLDFSAQSNPGTPRVAGSHLTCQVVHHSAYTLGYSEVHEQACWVQHRLTQSQLGGARYERSDDFRADPGVPSGSALPTAYKGSGYDRGHLAPAADFAWSATAMSESFFMSNMCPQVPALNRGIWARLEDAVRKWAIEADTLWVISGPMLEANMPELPSGVAIPKAFWKVVYDPFPVPKCAAFILPQAGYTGSFWDFAVAVDEVERRTGIDVLPSIADNLEEELERMVARSNQWQ